MLNIVRSRSEGKTMVSIGSTNGVSITISEELYRALVVRYQHSKWKNISDVERYLADPRNNFKDNPSVYGALLFEMLSKYETLPETPIVTGAGVLPNGRELVPENIQALHPLVTETGHEVGQVIGPSAMREGSALFHAQGFNNDNQTVKGRVLDVKNTKVPPRVFNQYASEFVKQLVPAPGIGVPVDYEEVLRTQNRPAQLRRSEQSRYFLHTHENIVSAFQKIEPVGKVGDPRNISSVSTDHTLRLSEYTYAFKQDQLLTVAFYLPGSTPSQITNRLRRMCDMYNKLIMSDYDRFDGTISLWLRENIEFASYLRWVHSTRYWELSALLRNEIGPKARTANGVRYNPGASRLSGSPLTTDGNTLINAFVDYCAGRLAGLAPDAAFQTIGLCYGDDGVSCRDAASIVAAVEALGLSVKIETATQGEPVSLLGRLFLDPWTTGASVQDPKRTIPKLHLSAVSRIVPTAIAACNKARGYLETDRLTPVIKNYFECVRRVYHDAQPDNDSQLLALKADKRYYAGLANENGWEQEESFRNYEVIADAMGVRVCELTQYCDALDAIDTLEQFMALPPMFSIKRVVTVESVVNGEVLQVNQQPKLIGDRLSQDRPLIKNDPQRKRKSKTRSPERDQSRHGGGGDHKQRGQKTETSRRGKRSRRPRAY
jgi:hypothetical protein